MITNIFATDGRWKEYLDKVGELIEVEKIPGKIIFKYKTKIIYGIYILDKYQNIIIQLGEIKDFCKIENLIITRNYIYKENLQNPILKREKNTRIYKSVNPLKRITTINEYREMMKKLKETNK